MSNNEAPLTWALTHVDLLSERYGGQALKCNDEFFAGAHNLIKSNEPVYISQKYTDRGKWMDGWETRRRREPGHDWCILRLGLPGKICAMDVDTQFFRGNAPQGVSIEGCVYRPLPDQSAVPDESNEWHTILSMVDIEAHNHNVFTIDDNRSWTHLRLNIYPDGGVARLRVYGEPQVDWARLLPNELVDLAASTNGGRALACSDMFFSPMNNLIAPGRGVNMGDGWETRRRRGPGHDWLIVKLACAGTVQRVLVDTCHFKGNYPESFTLEGTYTDQPDSDVALTTLNWVPILAHNKLSAHSEHMYQQTITHNDMVFTHVRLNIFPDGGVSRLRVFGYPQLTEEQA